MTGVQTCALPIFLNAQDAAQRGAEILTRTPVIAATREQDTWTVTLAGGRKIRARALVNAAGPWVADVLGAVMHANAPARVRLVKGSHIVVPRLVTHDRCYIFQNADNRIFFAIPYERDYTLIGTTDLDFVGDPVGVTISTDEIVYLCAGASEYFRKPVTPADVVWSYSGVRPLYDDGASAAQAATRDYVLELDAPAGQPAALSVFGGKITTFRRLAEAALAKLAPHLPVPKAGKPAGWTATLPLPGGDFPRDGFDALVADLQRRHPFLTPPLARRLARAYGTNAATLLDGATNLGNLGTAYGAGITAAELAYLVRHEFARTAADVVWRRGKRGLLLGEGEIARIDLALQRLL